MEERIAFERSKISAEAIVQKLTEAFQLKEMATKKVEAQRDAAIAERGAAIQAREAAESERDSAIRARDWLAAAPPPPTVVAEKVPERPTVVAEKAPAPPVPVPEPAAAAPNPRATPLAVQHLAATQQLAAALQASLAVMAEMGGEAAAEGGDVAEKPEGKPASPARAAAAASPPRPASSPEPKSMSTEQKRAAAREAGQPAGGRRHAAAAPALPATDAATLLLLLLFLPAMSLSLKGKTSVWVQTANARIRIWYEEDHGRTCYTGTVTEVDPSQGLSVWFDEQSSTEQVWVDGSDEWEWMDETPVDPACPFVAVRLSMRDGSAGHKTGAASLHARLDGRGVSAALAAKLEAIDAANGEIPDVALKPKRASGKRKPKGAPAPAPAPAPPASRVSARHATAAAATPVPASAAAPAQAVRSREETRCGLAVRSHHKRKAADIAGPSNAACDSAAAAPAAARPRSPEPPPPKPPTSTVRMREAGTVLHFPPELAEAGLAEMRQEVPPYPADLATKYGICPISGLPARYRDPLTGARYGSVAAFKQIRAEHAKTSGAPKTEEPSDAAAALGPLDVCPFRRGPALPTTKPSGRPVHWTELPPGACHAIGGEELSGLNLSGPAAPCK